MPTARPTLRRALPLLTAFAGLVALPALAQGVYRYVGPDGSVTFSDQPPPASTPARTVGGASSDASAARSPALPFALRQASSRYPVVIYTSAQCNPCRTAIAYLEQRGIPFTEKTVETNADIEALQRLSGGNSLPVLTVGRQQMRGFTATEWKQYLDAAGYPEQSALPAGYRRPAATPLVAVSPVPATREPAGTAAEGTPASSEPAAIPVTPPPGIRF
ncbi:MAG: glutaredoxin family protein [Burkholderiales bacterium]|nr:MAG: glutaredoxin family protein [Burkholderiales bacterium]